MSHIFHNHSPIIGAGENTDMRYFDTPRGLNINDNGVASPPLRRPSVNMKPPTFDGSEDFGEYLVQFEILVDLHQWYYKTKPLYLASSLLDNARALLSELSTTQRRDFNSLVAILNRRFGSVERSELFRAKLKNGTKSINSELAQSVKKFTRQAYPTADPDLTNVLSSDHFIDVLPDADLRLRLRESRPKSINEAETLPIGLETFKLADTQKVKQVNVIHSDTDSSLITSIREENKILRDDFQSLAKEIRALLNNGQKVKSNFCSEKLAKQSN